MLKVSSSVPQVLPFERREDDTLIRYQDLFVSGSPKSTEAPLTVRNPRLYSSPPTKLSRAVEVLFNRYAEARPQSIRWGERRKTISAKVLLIVLKCVSWNDAGAGIEINRNDERRRRRHPRSETIPSLYTKRRHKNGDENRSLG